MKTVKSFILGSAAGLFALNGALAADVPVKAKAIEFVRICSPYGAGFYYIPGTDTCLRVGGYLRVDTTFNGNIYNAPYWNGNGGAQDRFRHYFNSRSRLALSIDTRTATEYGVVRTFGQGAFNFSTFGAGTVNSAASPPASLLDTAGGGYVGVQYVFIQFAGFTFGKSVSAYATPWQGYPGNNTSFLLGGQDSITGVPNIQYGAQFGNGVSAAIGLDEPTVFDRTQLTNVSNIAAASAFTGAWGNSYAGVRAPDIVGNIRLDQAWGLLQFSAAAHNITASYYNPALETSGHPTDVWGFAIMGALQIKNIPTGPKDDIKIDASYSDGATRYLVNTVVASPNFGMFGGTNLAGAYQSVGFGGTTDGIYAGTSGANGTPIQKTRSWGVRGAFNHNWDPYWSSSLFGAATWVDYRGNASDTAAGIISATGLICSKYFAGSALVGARLFTSVSANYSCNPDFRIFQVGTVTRWTPLKDLTFSAEVLWTKLDQDFTGSALPVATPAALAKPVTVYEFRDQNTFSFNVRAQRNF